MKKNTTIFLLCVFTISLLHTHSNSKPIQEPPVPIYITKPDYNSRKSYEDSISTLRNLLAKTNREIDSLKLEINSLSESEGNLKIGLKAMVVAFIATVLIILIISLRKQSFTKKAK